MRRAPLVATLTAALMTAAGPARAGCTISGDDEVCSLVARGDERHTAGRQASGRGPAGAVEARRLYLEALDLYRRAAYTGGGAMHHNLLARIARELMFTDQRSEALAAAQECLAQVETDLESPAQAARLCEAPGALPAARQPLCQTWSACSEFVRTLSQARMQSAPQTSYFGFVVVQTPRPTPPGLRVYLTGNDLPLSLPERRFPVVPGTALVEAEAPGYRRFSQAVRVTPGESVTVTVALARGAEPGEAAPSSATLAEGRALVVEVDERHARVEAAQRRDARNPCLRERLSSMDDLLLDSRAHLGLLRGAFLTRNAVRLREARSRLAAVRERAEEVEREAASCSATAATAPEPTPHAAGERPPPRVPVGAWVVMGVGAATLAASGVMFLLRADAVDELDGQCGGASVRQCPESSRPLYDRGALYNGIGNVTLMVGAGLLLGGGVWALVGRRATAPPASSALTLRPLVSLSGLGLAGRF